MRPIHRKRDRYTPKPSESFALRDGTDETIVLLGGKVLWKKYLFTPSRRCQQNGFYNSIVKSKWGKKVLINAVGSRSKNTETVIYPTIYRKGRFPKLFQKILCFWLAITYCNYFLKFLIAILPSNQQRSHLVTLGESHNGKVPIPIPNSKSTNYCNFAQILTFLSLHIYRFENFWN